MCGGEIVAPPRPDDALGALLSSGGGRKHPATTRSSGAEPDVFVRRVSEARDARVDGTHLTEAFAAAHPLNLDSADRRLFGSKR